MRTTLLESARWCGLLRARERRAAGRLTILTYHRVLPDEQAVGYPFPSLAMPASAFDRQLAWLADRATVLPLDEALTAGDRGGAAPVVALTFDDGYRDNADIAAPLLERHGLRGTFFVASGFVERDGWMWYDRAILLTASSPAAALSSAAHAAGVLTPTNARPLDWVEALKRVPAAARTAFLDALPGGAAGSAEHDRFRAMRPEQVRALSERGHEIGSHTVSHDILTLAPAGELARELADSRRTLESWSKRPVVGFCYPNGSHDPGVVAAVARAGYRYACTTLPPQLAPRDDPFRLGRRDLVPFRMRRAGGGFHLTAFRAEISGLLDGLRPQPTL